MIRPPPRPTLLPYTTLFRSLMPGEPRLITFKDLDQGDKAVGITQSQDRKSTRLNSSHGYISYAVFCLKNKNHINRAPPLFAATHPTHTTVTSPSSSRRIRST